MPRSAAEGLESDISEQMSGEIGLRDERWVQRDDGNHTVIRARGRWKLIGSPSGALNLGT